MELRPAVVSKETPTESFDTNSAPEVLAETDEREVLATANGWQLLACDRSEEQGANFERKAESCQVIAGAREQAKSVNHGQGRPKGNPWTPAVSTDSP